MDRVTKKKHRCKQLLTGMLAGLSLVVCLLPCTAVADRMPAIRVGRFPYAEQLTRGEDGHYSGYGYDYLQEIALYTGWRYEFVDASWSDCLSMLERGELDLMGALMRSPERESIFAFSERPMISGYGVLATPLDNDTLPFEDFEAFDGLRVGWVRGNLHGDSFQSYSKSYGFTADIREYSDETGLYEALAAGEIEAAVLSNTLRTDTLRVVATFGENDGYFATTKGNTAILQPLNEAMRQISLQDPYFNSKLDEKYYDLQKATTISFTREELDFIQNSPPIPCVYIAAAPISYQNGDTKEVHGIAIEICRLLEEKTGLRFHWIHTSSTGEAIEMLRRGDALMLPAKYDDRTWAETNGMTLTKTYLKDQMVMVTNNHTQAQQVVALYDQGSQSRLAADAIANGAQLKQYNTILECMDAVLQNEANTTFVNSTIASYMMNNPQYAGLQITPLYNFSADVAMAVGSRANPLLLSVLNKGLQSISSTRVNEIVLSQMKIGQSKLLATYLYLHPMETITVVVVIFSVLILTLLVLLNNRRKNARAMWEALYIDPLTGAPNYRTLAQELPELVGKHPSEYALLYMDIRRFKVINDTFGYEIGNRVLTVVSNALKDFLGPYERMARVYADTFVLLLRFKDTEQLRARVSSLSSQLEQLSGDELQEVRPLFRGGIYLLPEGFCDLDQAGDRANYAKSSISRHYVNTFVFYNDVVHRQVLAEKELESGMFAALEQQQFIPYYQPKVNAITNRVTGVEALVRWQHPVRGILQPGDFLPFYEENGFIVKIDLTIFEQVCQDLQQWLQSGHTAVPVSVNFSRRHMQDKELPGKLKAIADQYGVPTNLLEIEITETKELENIEIADQFVGVLKSFGFGISIDDYGTGYSSISFLQQLPLDTLKLDRQFILNAMQSDRARDIMRYLVAAMQRNGIRLVCEGVETEEQRDFVIGLNCRIIQGYLYSPPVPRERFEEYLLRQGLDSSNHLDFIPILNFRQKLWSGAEDFVNQTMPSWFLLCFVEPNYPISYISPSFLVGLGYSELELAAQTDGLYSNLIHPNDLQSVLQLLKAHENSADDLLLQYRLRKKNGDYIWIRAINKRTLTEEGREALLGICTDITDMMTLQAERSRLIETVPGGVGELLLTDEGPVIQWANDHFYEVIGYTPEEMAAVDNNLKNIFYQQEQPEAMHTLQEILETGQPACECIFRVQHKDGSLHWVTFRGRISSSRPHPQATTIVYNSDEAMQARQSAEMNRAKLELALLSTGHAVFEYDARTKTVYSHRGFDAYGIADGIAINVTRDILENHFLHPEDAQKVLETSKKIAAGQPHVSYDARVRSRQSDVDAPYIWIRVTLTTVFDEDKQPTHAVGIVENINQQKHSELAYQKEMQYRKAFTESSLMAYEFNVTHDTIHRIHGSRGFRLEALCKQLDRPDCYTDVLMAGAQALVAADDRERYIHEMALDNLLQLYKDGIFEKEVEYKRLTPDGQELWNAALLYMVLDQLSGDIMGYAYHRDIQERKSNEKELANRAIRDSLTGALNRSAAEQQIAEFLAQPKLAGHISAFLMLDINRFKAVNDSYGHQMGDQYLVKLTQIILKQLRKQDIVGRMGGDEFAILLKNLSNKEVATAIAERLAREVEGIQQELQIALPTSVSIGIALYPFDGADFQTLYEQADMSMYHAKRRLDR